MISSALKKLKHTSAHLAGVVGTDGDAKLALDEGVVDEVSHIFERLPIVFTDTVTKMQLDRQTTTMIHI